MISLYDKIQWTRYNGAWCLLVPRSLNVDAHERATVYRRDGTASLVWVGQILEDTPGYRVHAVGAAPQRSRCSDCGLPIQSIYSRCRNCYQAAREESFAD